MSIVIAVVILIDRLPPLHKVPSTSIRAAQQGGVADGDAADHSRRDEGKSIGTSLPVPVLHDRPPSPPPNKKGGRQ